MQIKCLDSLPLHLPRTYHDVGEFACGQMGRVMVSAVTTLEYFGYACMQLILLWHQMEVDTQLCFPCLALLLNAHCSSGNNAEPLHADVDQYKAFACADGMLAVDEPYVLSNNALQLMMS